MQGFIIIDHVGLLLRHWKDWWGKIGVTNTSYFSLVSGFPPPLSYSLYSSSDAAGKVEANVINDYNKALQLAKAQHKPILIDFTGWACVNCRKMEENVWPRTGVKELIKNDFILVSLYVDDRKALPDDQQFPFITSDGSKKDILTIGDKFATLQSENFKNASQPLYVVISPDEKLMTKPVVLHPRFKRIRPMAAMRPGCLQTSIGPAWGGKGIMHRR